MTDSGSASMHPDEWMASASSWLFVSSTFFGRGERNGALRDNESGRPKGQEKDQGELIELEVN